MMSEVLTNERLAEGVAERLADKIQDNPGAFDFNDIEIAAETPKARASLEALVGGFVEEITTPQRVFFVRSPKLKEQREMARIRREADAISDDDPTLEERFLEVLAELGRCVLFVEERGQVRRATQEEIEGAFDARELQEILAKATGWQASSEGSSQRPQS